LSWSQFLDWAAFYKRHPTGGERDDLRFEAFRQRLLVALLGAGGCDVPEPTWPYFKPPLDGRDALRQLRELDARLVPHGQGYRWKEAA
jgi:hypothetical protein